MSIAKELVHVNVDKNKNWLKAAIILQASILASAVIPATEKNARDANRVESKDNIINFDKVVFFHLTAIHMM